jgi:glucans biosynthesis protein
MLPAPMLPAPMLAAPLPFSFDRLAARAQALAAAPYQPTPVRQPEVLEQIDYDAHWRIRYRPAMTLRVGAHPVQFFHLGTYFRQPVKMFVASGGTAQELVYARDYFDMPADSPARALAADAGFAGFRILHPDLSADWIAFLGASYFRTEGAQGQYGLSARGLAVDTGLPKGEEFPRFTEIYLEAAADGGLIVTALLEGRSITGAYRMAMANTPGKGQVMAVESRLFPRVAIARLGIAPLTSMFWYSESNRLQSTDWRPEVHDSDGLMILPRAGAADPAPLWRPLSNPGRIVSSGYGAGTPQGFGLLQRDRGFAHYQEDGVFDDRRP